MNKCLELPVALYGILKAGAAYVPIDSAAPSARVKFIAEDCGICHLITHPSHGPKAARVAAEVQGLRAVIDVAGSSGDTGVAFIPWPAVDAALPHDPRVPLVEQDLAYIMYTSGSTGVPKGLIHTPAASLTPDSRRVKMACGPRTGWAITRRCISTCPPSST